AGAVQRLTSILVRTVGRIGTDVVFEPSGEALWSSLRAQLRAVLLTLWHEGALEGATSAEAFDVRCDASTMTRADIDAGRAVCLVTFQPAVPIERITVVLGLTANSLSITTGEPS